MRHIGDASTLINVVVTSGFRMEVHVNPLARGSDLKTIRVHREDEIGTAAARVYYKRLLG